MQITENIKITARVLELAEEHSITPNLLCEIALMPRSSYSDIIKNNRFSWRVDWLARIAVYFNVTTDYLIFGDKDFVKKKNHEFVKDIKIQIKEFLLRDKKFLTYGKLSAEGFFEKDSNK